MKWYPTSLDSNCLRTNSRGAQYEDFPCLYPTLAKAYTPFEKNFDPAPYYHFMVRHPEIPIVAVMLYGAFIVAGQRYFRDRKPWNLRVAMAVWNLGLSVFSAIGVMRIAPQVVHLYTHYTVTETFCMDPEHLFASDGSAGLWLLLFAGSKIAELFDTFFIVVHKKPLILLHWWHHISVLLACWHAYVTKVPTGIVCGLVNYAVHSVMYFYYFLMAVKCKPKAFKAVWITIAQIFQMVVGIFVMVFGFYLLWSGASDGSGEPCHLRPAQLSACTAIFVSYLFLFLQFFFNRYKAKSKKQHFTDVPKMKKSRSCTASDNEDSESEASPDKAKVS